MDVLVDLGLPLALAVIMVSLGVGLELGDFTRVIRRWRAFLVGALCQMLGLPLVVLAVLAVVELPPELAAGVFLLSLCPGGVPSNLLAKLARGDVALSVSLTAVISVLSILTVPGLAAWGVGYFLADAAPQISVAALAFKMVLLTTVPVALGMSLRAAAPGLARRVEPGLTWLSVGVFLLVVAAALRANWAVFTAHFVDLYQVVVPLFLAMLALGLFAGWLARLSPAERKTIAIETGIQNGTLGIALAGMVTGTVGLSSPMALPSAVYGVLMYFLIAPWILLVRNRWVQS